MLSPSPWSCSSVTWHDSSSVPAIPPGLAVSLGVRDLCSYSLTCSGNVLFLWTWWEQNPPRHGILHGSPAAPHWKDQLCGEAWDLACMAGQVEENGIDVTEISNIYPKRYLPKAVSVMWSAWAGSDTLRATSNNVALLRILTPLYFFGCGMALSRGFWEEPRPDQPWLLFRVSNSERHWCGPNPYVIPSLTFYFPLLANNLHISLEKAS